MFLPIVFTMRAIPWSLRRSGGGSTATEATSARFHGMWDALARFALEIRSSDFMAAMIRRRDAAGVEGAMGVLDCATLYALTRWLQPSIVVESGGFIGMSSAFILKALDDDKLAAAKLYSIEWSEDCEQGALIPDELRERFVPLRGRVEDLLKRGELPQSIDLFLHDSSHSRRHMLWEFRQFWPRLRDGGLLVAHDVQMNAAFAEFVAQTYVHDRRTGRRHPRTSHYEWGRWGYIGFAVKKG
jgi:predicted O-methyltransferase YrrM